MKLPSCNLSNDYLDIGDIDECDIEMGVCNHSNNIMNL